MTPPIGYTEMKDSGVPWLGEIPSHWVMGKVKNQFVSGKDVVGDAVDNYERLALTLDGVIKRSKNDDTGLQPEKFETYQILRENELVFKLIDLQNVSTSRVGRSPYTGIVSPAYIILRDRENCSTKYAEYYFLSMWMHQVFNQLGADGVRSNIGTSALLSLPFLLVPDAEQSAIADYLDDQCAKIDDIIAEAKSSIEEYKQWKASVIYEAVTKGLDPGVEMKDSGIEWIGEIPKSWNINILFQLVSQVKNKNKDLLENNLLSLSYGKIKRKNIDAVDGLLPASFDGYNIIEANDIVLRLTDLQNDHTSLRVGRSTEHGIITSAYVTIRPSNAIISEYLYYLLHSFDIKKGFYGMGAGVRQGLTYDEIKLLKLSVPSVAEQSTIAAYLDTQCAKIDELISEKQALITDLEAYKKSLIFEVVTGKRKVC